MSGRDNNIPKGWVETTLGEVCIIGSSKRIFFSDYVEDGVPFYRSKEIIEKQKGGDISTTLFITEQKFKEIEEKHGAPKQNDLLLTSVGTLGIPYLVKNNERFYFKDGNLTWFRNYDGINPVYLYNWFLSSTGKESLNQITIGSTQSALTITGLKSIPILLPPLLEQQAIAAILTTFDDKIELLQAQNETLETIAQTIFKEWFGKYQVGDELPEGWRVGKIDDVVELIIDYRGKTPKKLGLDWSESGISALSAKTIKNGKIVRRDAMNFGSEELYSIWMKDELEKGDILLTSEAPLGEMYYLNKDTKYILSQRLFALRANEKITSQYLYHYLFSTYGQHLLNSRASGSTVEGIRQSELRKVEVIVPSQNILQIASNLFQSIFDKQSVNSEHILTLQQTRDTLLPKLMSGKLRVEGFKD